MKYKHRKDKYVDPSASFCILQRSISLKYAPDRGHSAWPAGLAHAATSQNCIAHTLDEDPHPASDTKNTNI